MVSRNHVTSIPIVLFLFRFWWFWNYYFWYIIGNAGIYSTFDSQSHTICVFGEEQTKEKLLVHAQNYPKILNFELTSALPYHFNSSSTSSLIKNKFETRACLYPKCTVTSGERRGVKWTGTLWLHFFFFNCSMQDHVELRWDLLETQALISCHQVLCSSVIFLEYHLWYPNHLVSNQVTTSTTDVSDCASYDFPPKMRD